MTAATDRVETTKNAPPALAGRRAVVTGASQGIGRAIALALARQGASVQLLGRSPSTLSEVAMMGGPGCTPLVADLESERSLHEVAAGLAAEHQQVDLLVHCGGQYLRGVLDDTPAADLDTQYQLTVRAPYVLTQLLLPSLRRRPSDIVFVGSTARPSAGLGAFVAMQAAQAALVESLRAELSTDDIRVLCIFPGRTATPRQQQIFAMEGRPDSYRPELLLQPEDVARATLDALSLPRRAEMTEVWIRPAEASY